MVDSVPDNLVYVVLYYVAGSLGTSVFDMKAYLVGASGGVYSLLAAHLANIMLVCSLCNKFTSPIYTHRPAVIF